MNRSSIRKLGYKILYTTLYQGHQVYCKIRNPEVFGSYVLCIHDTHVLLIKNSYKKYWTLPCGGIAAGETPIEAAVRESKEEAGLTLHPENLLLRAKILYEGENQRDNIHLFEYAFDTRPSIHIDLREVEDYCWVSKEDVHKYTILDPILPYVHEALGIRR